VQGIPLPETTLGIKTGFCYQKYPSAKKTKGDAIQVKKTAVTIKCTPRVRKRQFLWWAYSPLKIIFDDYPVEATRL
jgi:hypothetical protein